jgi:MFS transporter, SP family, arabinose:H+ symporter
MNGKIILWSVTVGLAGLLFGLDVAVISGAERTIQKLWGLSDLMHGTAIAMALYGTIVGAAFGNYPANKYGRKITLIWIGVFFLVTSIGAAIAPNVEVFMFFRFLSGLSIGASSVVAPVYISEIAPPKHRGKLGVTFQLSIVAGILLAYGSNYLLNGVGGENDWRWMLGVVAIPSLFFCILMMQVPETPRWLLLYNKNEQEAKNVLQMSGHDNVENAIQIIKNSVESNHESVFKNKYIKPILLAFFIASFNQFSGINAVIYFAPRIFELAGLATQSAFLGSVGVGIVNLIFTILGWSLIDKFGRRTLLIIGSLGYIVSLSLIAYSFYTSNNSLIIYYIFLFIAAHAVGQGAVIWVFISEIFPNAVRAKGMSIGSFTHWFWAAMVSQFFPVVAGNANIGPAKIFLFFAVMMVFQLIFALKIMPETKGVALEEFDNNKILAH